MEFCQIAEKIVGLNKTQITFLVESQFSPLTEAYKDPGRRIIGKKYITDADASKAGACQKCLEYANRIFKWPQEAHLMPKLPLHPNCKCHYEDVYEKPSEYEIQKTVVRSAFDLVKRYVDTKIYTVTEEYLSKIYEWSTMVSTLKITAPLLTEIALGLLEIKIEPKTAMYNIEQTDCDFDWRLKLFGKTIDGYDDLIRQLKKRSTPVEKLVFIKHNIDPGTMSIGKGSNLDNLSDKQISELKKYLSSNCIIYVRACRDANGKNAQNKYRRFAKRIKRLVVAYQGYVSPLGGNPSHVKEFDVKNMRFYIIWYPECQPIIFSPY